MWNEGDLRRVRIFTRSLDDITDRVPEAVDAIRDLPVTSGVFDGELIALRPDGRPQPFQVTSARLSNTHLVARDESSGDWVMVGKTFKGMTDEMLSRPGAGRGSP